MNLGVATVCFKNYDARSAALFARGAPESRAPVVFAALPFLQTSSRLLILCLYKIIRSVHAGGSA